ncbi:hypothetical protein CASFOL_027513 [Castilleja foliolosa]|uniref:ACT domain-containing protein ACR n=1 Tax=Castilleja foliolosa TaxID=1961234 RepID=A0ABD3CFW5_9LAMI
MEILFDDAVIIRQSEKEDEDSVITVNCLDKTGLGSDLCRIILLFGLTVARTDASTDGKWCYIVFWVVGKPSTRWGLLKKRLMGCHDRRGLLHDVTEVLCELELTIKRVKVSTTPDGKVMDLFFITDTRELLHTNQRKEDACGHLKAVLGDAMIKCDIEIVGPEITACSQGPSFLSDAITQGMFDEETLDVHQYDSLACKCPSVTMDISLSPSHTLLQIACQNHKGVLYDVTRTLKDYNIQISYGRFTTKGKKDCEMDLFIMQADGKKKVDPSKQNGLRSRLQMELTRPIRVSLTSRGPDTELLVANPVELSGKGRPLVFYDITLALKMLDIPIFSAEIGRYMIGDREWELYRVLLDEGENSSVSKKKIEETVWKMLMCW